MSRTIDSGRRIELAGSGPRRRCRRDVARAAIAFMVIEAYTRNAPVMLRRAQFVQRSLTALAVGFVPLLMFP